MSTKSRRVVIKKVKTPTTTPSETTSEQLVTSPPIETPNEQLVTPTSSEVPTPSTKVRRRKKEDSSKPTKDEELSLGQEIDVSNNSSVSLVSPVIKAPTKKAASKNPSKNPSSSKKTGEIQSISKMLGITRKSTGRKLSPKTGEDDGNSVLKVTKRDEKGGKEVDVKTYELDNEILESSSTTKHTHSTQSTHSLILQIPLTLNDLNNETASNYYEERNQVDNLPTRPSIITYDPEDIVASGPKPIIQSTYSEILTDSYEKTFQGCSMCSRTIEGSWLPCEKCIKDFDSQSQSLDSLLLERAKQDQIWPDRNNFENCQIVETKLPSNLDNIDYEADVIIDIHPTMKSNETTHQHNELNQMEQNVDRLQPVQEIEESPYDHTLVTHPKVGDNKAVPQGIKLTLHPKDVLPIRFNVLNEFTKLDKWPKQTNVHCWWDCHPFNTHPIGIPLRFDILQNRFITYGCFCSFECAMAYKKEDSRLKDISNDLFYNLQSKIQGNSLQKPDTKIKCALPRKSLLIFGGQLTIDAFRKYSTDNNIVNDIITYPLIPIVETIDIYYASLDGIPSNIGTSPTLKLKRTKPLPNAPNTLHTTLQALKNI